MNKLGIVREDVTPHETDNGVTTFECDNKEKGESTLFKKAEEIIESESKLGTFLDNTK
jgi:hypothetical protein